LLVYWKGKKVKLNLGRSIVKRGEKGFWREEAGIFFRGVGGKDRRRFNRRLSENKPRNRGSGVRERERGGPARGSVCKVVPRGTVCGEKTSARNEIIGRKDHVGF